MLTFGGILVFQLTGYALNFLLPGHKISPLNVFVFIATKGSSNTFKTCKKCQTVFQKNVPNKI